MDKLYVCGVVFFTVFAVNTYFPLTEARTDRTRLVDRKRRGFGTALTLVAKRGAMAVKLLTTGATRYPSAKVYTNPADNLVRLFVKEGDCDRAVQDLYKVSPHNVKSFVTITGIQGKAAIVGDRIIHVKYSNEINASPTIEVFQMVDLMDDRFKKVVLTDLIIYSPK